jgi:hypothetical protein
MEENDIQTGILIQPSYFPSISTFIAIAKEQIQALERKDNFRNKSNRNRMYIYSRTDQLLNVPVKRTIHFK